MSNNSGRLVALDAWRGILAVVVIFYHLITCFFSTGLHQSIAWRGAYVLVDAFFAISGFIIARVYFGKLSNRHELKAFLIRRVFRLVPLNLVILALFLLYRIAASQLTGEAVFSGPAYELAGFVASALFAQSFGTFSEIVWNGPAWSIGAEFYVYALFAGVALLCQRTVSFLLVALVLIVVSVAVMSAGSTDIKVDYDYGVWRCIYGFLVGALTMHLLRKLESWPGLDRLRSVLQWLSIPGMLAFMQLGAHGRWSFLAPICFAFIVIAYSSDRGFWARILHARPFAFLARTSYSIYMVHWLVLIALTQILVRFSPFGHMFSRDPLNGMVQVDSLPTIVVLYVVVVAVTLACAALTYRFIELPGQRLGERFVPPRSEKQAEERCAPARQ